MKYFVIIYVLICLGCKNQTNQINETICNEDLNKSNLSFGLSFSDLKSRINSEIEFLKSDHEGDKYLFSLNTKSAYSRLKDKPRCLCTIDQEAYSYTILYDMYSEEDQIKMINSLLNVCDIKNIKKTFGNTYKWRTGSIKYELITVKYSSHYQIAFNAKSR